mgnify:FL=1
MNGIADHTPRGMIEAALLKSPQELLETARSIHQTGDRMRKNLERGYQEWLSEAENAYNALLNRSILGSPQEGQLPAFILLLLGMMDQQRGWNGRAVSIARLAEAYARNMPEQTQANRNLLANILALQGYGLRAEGFRVEAEERFKGAMDLSPDDPEILAGCAGIYINDGHPQKVIDLLNRAEKLKPGMTKEEHWNLALAHLELGHWHIGFDLYHKGIAGKERLNQNYWASGTTPEWDGSPGKSVVIYGEQGLGDEIMFASILPEAIRTCRKVIIDCHPRLEEIFRRSFQGCEVFGTRKSSLHEWAAGRADIDAQCALGTLGKFFRSKDADFPQYNTGYMEADHRQVLAMRHRLMELGPGPYIGIAWSGGSKKTRFDLRSAPLKLWAPLLGLPAKFVSIHYMPEAAEAAERFGIPHWQEVIDDMDSQFALVKACDLIISVNQTLVHVAGSLAKPCWTLTPGRPAWRYGLDGTRMIWYPTVRQFRQRLVGDTEEPWQFVFERVVPELQGFIRKWADPGLQGMIREMSMVVDRRGLEAS